MYHDDRENEALTLLAQISELNRQLRAMADTRSPITAADVCKDRCNFTDRAVEREVQAFMNRYDAVYVPDLAAADGDRWELLSTKGHRFVVTELTGQGDHEDDDFYEVTDTETGDAIATHYDECDAETERDQLNLDDTRENLNGFPFAQNHGYEIEEFEIEQFASAGFLVYRYDGDRLIAGIDGGGYSFLGGHWFPLWWNKAIAGGWVIDTDSGPRRVA